MAVDYDAIVIGSGMGGLAAAAVTSAAGLRTLVVEKNPVAGGYLSSFKRGGYLFDSTIDCIAGAGQGGLIYKLLELTGVRDNIEFLQIKPIRLSIFPDLEVTVDSSAADYEDRLKRLFPHETVGIEALFKTMERTFRALMLVMELSALTGGGFASGAASGMLRLQDISYGDFLKDYVHDGRLIAVLSDRCPFIGLPPSRVSALTMITLIMSYFQFGAYRPGGGTQRLANVLVDGVKNKGGTVITSAAAKGIVLDGAKAAGVLLENGAGYRSKYVISGCDYYETFHGLIGAGYGAPAESAIQSVGVSTSFFIVYAGVAGLVSPKASSIGFFPSYDIEKTFAGAFAPGTDSITGITIATVEDPGRAPNGGHTVVVHEMADGEGFTIERPLGAETVLKKAGRILSGGIENPQIVETAMPTTLTRYTGNHAGAAFGWRQTPGYRGRLPGHGIDNLYIAGHWDDMGGGVLAAAYSGVRAANRILHKEGLSVDI
ncbi:phytoene desaturase family protein [Candidatus Magnetominusculus dajiuhuensis]|uniref:phytoene desaturase family protein n=1 Tax=Candidatus Magnetominusculus dajiuhuensis TaxID=3137712 RepID=UPI003B429462